MKSVGNNETDQLTSDREAKRQVNTGHSIINRSQHAGTAGDKQQVSGVKFSHPDTFNQQKRFATGESGGNTVRQTANLRTLRKQSSANYNNQGK